MFFNSKILAKKYAIAFLNIFSQKMKISDCDQCESAAEFLQKNNDFFFLLQAPFISKKKQLEVLQKIRDRYNLPSVFEKITNLLRSDNRLFLLPEVLQAIAQEYRKRNDYVIFTITSSHELSEHDRSVIIAYLQATTEKKIIPQYAQDTKLIAGVRIQSSTLLWEYSIQKQLQTIKKSFIRQELSNGH